MTENQNPGKHAPGGNREAMTQDSGRFTREQNAGLTEKQRALLLLAATYFRDEQLFQAANPNLQLDEDRLNNAQRLFLNSIKSDRQSFEQKHDSLSRENATTLNNEQRKLLKLLASELSDPDSFSAISHSLQALNQRGQGMSENAIADLREYLLNRSQETELQEFNRSSGTQLGDADEELEMKALLLEDEPKIASEELDNIAAPNVLDADRRKIRTGLEENEEEERSYRKGLGGIIGRVGDVIGTKHAVGYQRKEGKKQMPITLMVASVSTALLSVVAIMIPLSMQSSGAKRVEDKFAQEELQRIVETHITQQVPLTMNEHVLNNGGFIAGAARPSAPSAAQQVREQIYRKDPLLSEARQLRWQGKTEDAIRILEPYVLKNPTLVSARIELASCYLKLKQLRKARFACIAGLTNNPSAQEKAMLWEILNKCLKG